MASKGPSPLRSEIQQEIKIQGEIIRQLKLEEQTDEVKDKVSFCGFPYSVLWISSIKPVCKKNTWALKHSFLFDNFCKGTLFYLLTTYYYSLIT